jgi:precorrin-2/cobalt-factor-2 C20-methyltransferase
MPHVHNKLRGKFYGVGLGPGDPKLLTIKAKEVLRKVNTIFVPISEKDKTSWAQSIVEAVIEEPKEIIKLIFPMTKNKNVLLNYWQSAAYEIAKRINEGKEVAFVTIGDPFIYSTYNYLLKALREYLPNIHPETIPGVSSFSAAASKVGVPLVEGEGRLAILPAGEDLNRSKWIFDEFDTVVLMKIGSKLNKVVKFLDKLGYLKHSTLVSHVGCANEQVIEDLSNLEDKRAGYLSVIIVRKVRF